MVQPPLLSSLTGALELYLRVMLQMIPAEIVFDDRLSHPAPLSDGFFVKSNLRAESLSGFAESEIKPNHIHEGYQDS